MRAALLALALALPACSSGSNATAGGGKLVAVLSIDWEGAVLDPDGFAAIDALRARVGTAPLTHFVSSAYFTKPHRDRDVPGTIARAIRPGDELAVHLHAWRSLAQAAGLAPRVAPSFLTGTDQMVDLEDGDLGFDTDLDTYDVPALRALLQTSRRLLEQTHVPVSRSFRAGGYLATPKMLLALGDEGYAVDSSAVDPHAFSEDVLAKRLAQVWPHVDRTTQPFVVPGGAGQSIVELPIATVVDYVSTDDIVKAFEAAHARLAADPAHDQFVVIAFHLETASDYASHVGDALDAVRARPELAGELTFATVDQAAELARFDLAPPPAAR